MRLSRCHRRCMVLSGKDSRSGRAQWGL
jgi:hypothetical protein